MNEIKITDLQTIQSLTNIYNRNLYQSDKDDSEINSNLENDSTVTYNPYHDEDIYDNIKVYCRFRPDININQANSYIEYVSNKEIMLNTSYSKGNYSNIYKFDGIFKDTDNQDYIFKTSCIDILKSVVEGHNGCIIAYGQTGSGKTYTMTGSGNDYFEEGIIQRCLRYIYDILNKESYIKVSIAEIYNEKVNDLIDLSNKNLTIKKSIANSVDIDKLSEYKVNDYNEIIELIKKSSENRKTTSTILNNQSSRSHYLIIINIKQENTLSKLVFVDLAGSERIGKSGISDINIDETKNINKSLSNLGLVINCLTNKDCSYVPYRDSKLTRILSDSIGGNSKTSIILTCSMNSINEMETISTLRFGIRAKAVKNNCIINYNSYKKDEDSLYKTIEILKMRINHKDKIIKDLKNKLHHKNINEVTGKSLILNNLHSINNDNQNRSKSFVNINNNYTIKVSKQDKYYKNQCLNLKKINENEFEIIQKDNYDYSLYDIKIKSNKKEFKLYFMDETELKQYMTNNISSIYNINNKEYSYKRNKQVYEFLLKTIQKRFSDFYNQTMRISIKNDNKTMIKENNIEISILNNEKIRKDVSQYKENMLKTEKLDLFNEICNFEKEKKLIFSILNEKTIKIEELKLELNEKDKIISDNNKVIKDLYNYISTIKIGFDINNPIQFQFVVDQ